MRSIKVIFSGAALALAMSNVWAGLGGSPARFGPHVAASAAHPASAGNTGYSQIQQKLDSGTIVNEYLDAQGRVFAVSWSGPFLPDLKEILGPHFDAMTAQAQKQRAGGRSPLHVKQSDVVIDSAGHMGDFHGRAWLPAQLPAGFDPQAIQ